MRRRKGICLLLGLMAMIFAFYGCERAVLLSITVTPKSPPSLAINSVQDFTASGKYSDGTSKDITSQVMWVSSDTSVVSMYSYDVTFAGTAYAQAEGKTYITASGNSITSPAIKITVLPIDKLLEIYLDSNCAKLWDSINQPDLSKIIWEPAPAGGSPYSWQQGILTVYLFNTSNISLSVNAEINIRAAQPGFSVSSDIIVVKPQIKTPLNITIKQSPFVLGNLDISLFNVWFNIRKAE